ncbi:hypothetical protein Brms1b_011261 [Colletotrichum noveboracense]|nr:hypothetical protein Brms1b_011261 [Colletotrichum noveboracense]
MQIVNRESARGFAKDPVSIDTDHAGLNKFNSPAHPGFKAIKTVIEKLRAKPLIQQADDVLVNKHYTSAKLMIKRLSGEELPMDQCYINLSIVEQVQAKKPSQDEGEAKDSAPKSSPFSLFARLNIETSSDKSQVQLKDLFSQRKRTDGTEISPRRILIRGRAGVGKTTLCKKMVHEFVGGGMWRDLFDRVLWVPLRNLKERPAPGYNLERFLFDEFFRLQGDKPGKLFAEETSKALKDNRTLLILDGWDEVNQIATANTDMSRFLCDELLRQPNIIITSRPYASIPVQGQPIDLELETIGFNLTQVDEYIEKTHDKTDTMKVDEIKTFLQRHELVRSLVRIPIQLDAFCYCWDDNNYGNNKVDTMTALYQAIQTSLWKKDIPRLGEEHGIPTAQTNELKHSDQVLIEKDVREEIGFLEHLAFDGLVADKLEFDWGDINRTWDKEITHRRTRSPGNTLPCLSFLRTSDPSAKSVGQSYHFIHLTFQEYYAARYFVRHWNSHRSFEPNQQSQEPITPHRSLRKHKYDARYNIVWRFVAGLLDETEKAGSFFDEIEQGPVDVLGPAHQRLVMHCLNEALNLSKGLRKQREDKIYQWVLFERNSTRSSTFIKESEIPEGVLNHALRASGDKTIFLDALRGSQRHLSDATMAALVELFKDKNSNVRRSAARALGKQSTLSDATVAALMGLLKNKNRNVRSSAAEALGKQSTLSDVTITALVELFKDKNSNVRMYATRALGKQSTLSDATVAALMELFKHKNSDVRWSAAEALGKQSTLPDTTITARVELFKDEDSIVRRSAAYALGKQSTLSDATVAALVELFKDEDWYVRWSAARALGKQSTLSDATVAALMELFKHKNSFIRSSAARALGNHSMLSDATVTALMELFKDEDSNVRRSAAYALGNQSTLSDATVAALVELFKDNDRNVRRSAAEALGKQSTLSDATIAALVELFKHENSFVRRSAAKALDKQSTLSDATVVALVELFKDEDNDVRSSAVEALGNQSKLSDAAIAALVELFKDEDSDVRSSAAKALGNQSTLSDKILDALGLSIQPQTRTQLVPYGLCYSQDVAVFYESFLRRSFREHFSLHVGETFCIINQASVIRKATLQDQGQFQEAIRRARGELEQDLYLPSLDLS